MNDQPLFIIRKASASDAPGILECLQTAFERFRESYTPGAFGDTVLTPETLEQRFSTMSLFVAVTSRGDVVGTIACGVISQEEGHIRGMAVRPSWQGRGVAIELLRAAEAQLRDRGFSLVMLETTEPLERAVRFYEKCGYYRSGKVTDFFGMPLFEYSKEL